MQSYQDVNGVWTIGYGTTKYANGLKVREGEEVNVTEAAGLLRMHAYQALEDAADFAENFGAMSPVRQLVLGSMAYQMGAGRLGLFVNTQEAVRRRQWSWAAEEMLDSKWAREDSPQRAFRLSVAMMEDTYPDNSVQRPYSGIV